MTPADLKLFINRIYQKKGNTAYQMFRGAAPEIGLANTFLDDCKAQGVTDMFQDHRAQSKLIAILFTAFGRYVGGAYTELYGISTLKRITNPIVGDQVRIVL
jgi:hypothetical protein